MAKRKGKLYLEASGTTHWWDRSAASRNGVLKVLRILDRVLTPGRLAKLLPPLPPKLWRKMRRLRPDLYEKPDRKAAQVRVPRREWVRFLEACDRWQVTSGDALLAFMTLMSNMVEADDADNRGTTGAGGESLAEQRRGNDLPGVGDR